MSAARLKLTIRGQQYLVTPFVGEGQICGFDLGNVKVTCMDHWEQCDCSIFASNEGVGCPHIAALLRVGLLPKREA